MKDPRAWTYAAVFGALWGAIECTLGAVLKLTQLPWSGVIMACLAVALLVVLRRLQPAFGICLVAGVTAALLVSATRGALALGPVIAILLEAALVELFLAPRSLGTGGAMIAGFLATLASPLQKLLVLTLIVGEDVLSALSSAAESALRGLGLPPMGLAWLLALVLVFAGVPGALAGLAGVRLSRRVALRLGVRR